jgi:hypothetical protein
MGKKPRSGSGTGMNIRDHIPESLETIFGLKYSNSDADPGTFWTLDPWSRMEKIHIRDQG